MALALGIYCPGPLVQRRVATPIIPEQESGLWRQWVTYWRDNEDTIQSELSGMEAQMHASSAHHGRSHFVPAAPVDDRKVEEMMEDLTVQEPLERAVAFLSYMITPVPDPPSITPTWLTTPVNIPVDNDVAGEVAEEVAEIAAALEDVGRRWIEVTLAVRAGNSVEAARVRSEIERTNRELATRAGLGYVFRKR